MSASATSFAGLMERQAAKSEDHTTRLSALRAKITDAEGRLGRLYAAIESGVADLNDQTLKDRVAAVKTERDLAQIAYERAVAETNPRACITDEKIATFVETMRSNVMTGDTPFRRAYIRSVIDQVEVDDEEIRIWGRKVVLERLVAASGSSGPAGVPSFVRKWRARTGSNRRPFGFEDRYSIQLSYGREKRARHSTKGRRGGSAPAQAPVQCPGAR